MKVEISFNHGDDDREATAEFDVSMTDNGKEGDYFEQYAAAEFLSAHYDDDHEAIRESEISDIESLQERAIDHYTAERAGDLD